MILDTNHFSFTVSNLDQSIAFYQNALGLKLLNRSTRDVEFSQAVTGIQGASLDHWLDSLPQCGQHPRTPSRL